MNLAQTQTALWRLITQPRPGVTRAASRIVQSTPAFPAHSRVTVYADMYFWRSLDALRADFPCLSALLSDAALAALTRRYLKAWPSQHHDLGRAGWKLPGFLKRSRPKGTRADLADLAALEWARDEASLAADAVPVTLADMALLAPARFGSARLTFVPSVRLVTVKHDVARLWRAIEAGKRAPSPLRSTQHLLVWRKGFESFHSVVGATEARALKRAMAGSRVADVLAPWGTRPAAAAEAFAALGSWVREEMVASVN